jgi:hypothetical protein
VIVDAKNAPKGERSRQGVERIPSFVLVCAAGDAPLEVLTLKGASLEATKFAAEITQ